MEKIAVCWFRRDLRWDDNNALYKALSSGRKVLPVFIFDTEILGQLPSNEDRRVDLIYQALENMNAQLGSSQKICYYYGKPAVIFEKIIQQYPVEKVYCNEDYEPYAINRDEAIKNLLNRGRIDFERYKDQVIFHKNDVLKATGSPYIVYTPFSKAWRDKFRKEFLNPFPSETLLANILPTPLHVNFGLNDIGFKKTGFQFKPPGLRRILKKDYGEKRDIPIADSTTRLSMHLRFGTISVRKALSETQTSFTFWNEMIWREFFMQILFHFPKVQTMAFREIYGNFQWKNNEEDFRKWCEGETGFPIVDAGMRELHQTGYMHNRVRMITASFLIKHLQIDWKWGEAYFAEKLIDFDLALNNGNWQWVAGTGVDASPGYRVFNPQLQQEKFDKEFLYIKKWIPEFGTRAYPKPMVDHATAREEYLQKLKG